MLFIICNVNILQKEVNVLKSDNNKHETHNMQESMRCQQIFPGIPGIGSPGQRQPTPPRQERIGPPSQPPSAPPAFTPQLPSEEEQQLFSGPRGFMGPDSRRIFDFRRRPRNLRNCMNRFTYIWLINGSNFWFYPIFVGRNSIEGFRWRRNRWEYDRLLTNRILFHLCF